MTLGVNGLNVEVGNMYDTVHRYCFDSSTVNIQYCQKFVSTTVTVFYFQKAKQLIRIKIIELE